MSLTLNEVIIKCFRVEEQYKLIVYTLISLYNIQLILFYAILETKNITFNILYEAKFSKVHEVFITVTSLKFITFKYFYWYNTFFCETKFNNFITSKQNTFRLFIQNITQFDFSFSTSRSVLSFQVN